jgi:complex III assembly factor LYRM7
MAAAEGLAAYRAVLRAARRTFSGDDLMLTESAVEIRRRFEEHRRLAPGSEDAARALSEAREAAHFITNMIVQAQRAPSGSFGTASVIHTTAHRPLGLLCLLSVWDLRVLKEFVARSYQMQPFVCVM